MTPTNAAPMGPIPSMGLVYVPTWTVASCGKRREIYTIYMDCKGPIVGLEFQRTPARTKSQFTRNITFTTLKYLFHHQSKKSISHKDTTRKPSMTMENQPFEDVSLIQKKMMFHCHVGFRWGCINCRFFEENIHTSRLWPLGHWEPALDL